MDTFSLRLNFAAPVVGTIQNVLHYDLSTNTSDNLRKICEGLIGGWKASVWPSWAACIPNTTVLTALAARRVTGTGGPTYTIIEELAGNWNGQGADTGLAMDIALAPTDFPWQPGHIFLGPVPSGIITDNIWDSGFLHQVQLLCNVLAQSILPVPAAGYSFIQTIYSKKLKASRTIAEWLIKTKPTSLNKRLKPFP